MESQKQSDTGSKSADKSSVAGHVPSCQQNISDSAETSENTERVSDADAVSQLDDANKSAGQTSQDPAASSSTAAQAQTSDISVTVFHVCPFCNDHVERVYINQHMQFLHKDQLNTSDLHICDYCQTAMFVCRGVKHAQYGK